MQHQKTLAPLGYYKGGLTEKKWHRLFLNKATENINPASIIINHIFLNCFA